MNLMKKFRKDKGITLIALVVTIIVLLILAGISINMLTGQNGILKRATEAKKSTGEAQERENIQVAITSAQTEDFAKESEITDETLRKEIKNTMGSDSNLSGTGPWVYHGKTNNYTIEKNGSLSKKVPAQEGTLAYMYEKALADGCDNGDGTCTNSEHLHKGDYVNLTNPTEGSITISASDSGTDSGKVSGVTDQTFNIAGNQLNWRVLGENDAGEIELISGSPMKSTNVVDSKNVPGLYMYGAKAYVNGVEILNNICKMYKENDKTGYISSARSVTQSDVDKAVGLTSIDMIKEKNLDKYNRDKQNGNWKVLGEKYSYPNQYTPEGWLNGKTQTTVSGEVTAYVYSVNSKMADDAPSVTVNDRVYKMLFENAELNTGKAYWLASRSVSDISGSALFCLSVAGIGVGVSNAGGWRVFSSDGGERDCCAAVRPVVSLKSNVTNTQVPKIADKTEETWNNS